MTTIGEGDHGGMFFTAFFGVRTARMEGTSLGRRDRARHLTGKHLLHAPLADLRSGGE